jgi:hypothetical protein
MLGVHLDMERHADDSASDASRPSEKSSEPSDQSETSESISDPHEVDGDDAHLTDEKVVPRCQAEVIGAHEMIEETLENDRCAANVGERAQELGLSVEEYEMQVPALACRQTAGRAVLKT